MTKLVKMAAMGEVMPPIKAETVVEGAAIEGREWPACTLWTGRGRRGGGGAYYDDVWTADIFTKVRLVSTKLFEAAHTQ